MPAEMQASLTGYGSEAEKNLTEAQAIMQKLGYSDAKPLQIKIQNAQTCRPTEDPARDRLRPAQEDLHRRRARHSGYASLVRQAAAQGLHDRPQTSPA